MPWRLAWAHQYRIAKSSCHLGLPSSLVVILDHTLCPTPLTLGAFGGSLGHNTANPPVSAGSTGDGGSVADLLLGLSRLLSPRRHVLLHRDVDDSVGEGLALGPGGCHVVCGGEAVWSSCGEDFKSSIVHNVGVMLRLVSNGVQQIAICNGQNIQGVRKFIHTSLEIL